MRWWQAGASRDHRVSEGWLGWHRQQRDNGCWAGGADISMADRMAGLDMARRDRLNAREAVDLRHRQTKVRQDSKKHKITLVGLSAVTTRGTERSGEDYSEEPIYCRSWLVDGEQVCRMRDSQRWFRPRPDKQSHTDTDRETDEKHQGRKKQRSTRG